MNPKLFSLAMSEIGDKYIEEAMTYQAPSKRRVRPLLRIALAACLAIIMVFGTAMAVSAEFREAVVGWINEQYETFTHYEYFGEPKTDDPDDEGSVGFVPHMLTEVPPGYAEAESICDKDAGQQIIIYRNDADGKVCFVSAGSGGNAYVESTGCTIRPVVVSGAEGQLYIPDDPTKDSCIAWTKDNMFFYISGDFTSEELIYYAERFQPITAQDSASPS